MSYKIKINPVKAVTNLGYAKRDIIGPSDKCYSICSAFSSGDDAYNIDKDCAKECDSFVEKRRREVYGVGRCDHQAPYRPVIWDNIPNLVPKFVKKGKSPEEALQLAREMCKNVPNLYNECVDLAELHYNAIEKIYTGPSGPTGSPPIVTAPSEPPSVVTPPSESFKPPTDIPQVTENYKHRTDNSILIYTTFMFLIIFIVLTVLVHSKVINI